MVTWRTESRSSNWGCSPIAPSAHYWWANQFRLLLSSLAYVLMEAIRRLALKGTGLARATDDHDPAQMFKIGAVIIATRDGSASCSPALSLSGAVFPGGGTTQAGIDQAECCPGTLINNGGKGESARRVENQGLIEVWFPVRANHPSLAISPAKFKNG